MRLSEVVLSRGLICSIAQAGASARDVAFRRARSAECPALILKYDR